MDATYTALLAALAGIAGLILGSFATCAGHRLATGGSVLVPARSYCPVCGRTLAWHDNIPLLGWLLQLGRCRMCGYRISVRYPLAELALGLFCAGAALQFGPGLHLAVAMGFGALLLTLALVDAQSFLLPDRLTLPGALAALLCSGLLPPLHTLGIGWGRAGWGMLAGGGGLWALSALYRRIRGVEGMGLGDAKLMLMAGALLGPVAVGLAVFWGAALSLPFALAAARRDAAAQEGDELLGGTGLAAAIPFGPFLCAGTALYLLYGPQIVRWWLGG